MSDAQYLTSKMDKPIEKLELFSPPARASAQDAEKNAPEAVPYAPEKAPDHKHRTTGNKIYDWGIYTTFAWAGVAALSAISAHEADHGTNKYFGWLRALNKTCIDGCSKFFSNTIMKGKPPETIHGWAKGTSMFVTLGLGGWAMMAPIKWLEDHRERNAAKIDNFLGTTPPDPKLVEKEVEQSWNSVLKGRLMSWGLSYAAFAAMGPKLTGKISNWFGKHATDAFMAIKPSANRTKVKHWADIAAFDATFTVITASATYAFSRMFAKRNMKDKDHESNLMTFDPATPTPLEPVINHHDDDAPQKRFADAHPPKARPVAKGPDSYSEKAIQNKSLEGSAPQIG